MRDSLIFKACRFARGASVVLAVVLLCLGVLLSLFFLPGSGSERASALGTSYEAHGDQGANNGNAPPLDGTHYSFALAEEAEQADNSPVNAGLLTMLFLAAFFGASAGWLLPNAQGQRASCFSSVGFVGEVLGSARQDYLPFLGVFRL
jgi:hypothetical protein